MTSKMNIIMANYEDAEALFNSMSADQRAITQMEVSGYWQYWDDLSAVFDAAAESPEAGEELRTSVQEKTGLPNQAFDLTALDWVALRSITKSWDSKPRTRSEYEGKLSGTNLKERVRQQMTMDANDWAEQNGLDEDDD